MSQLLTEDLVRKIARILETESAAADLSSILSGIEKLNERLDRLEQRIPDSAEQTPRPVFRHPSQDRFAIAEAVADSIFAEVQTEKTCTFEPNARPCDHCSMCSSRGF